MMELAVREGKEEVIAGDFNCNLLHPNSVAQDLLATAEECNLKQLVMEPTRVTDRTETMIDLLFSSHPHSFMKVGCTDLTDSDHLMIYVVYQEEVKVTKQYVRMVRNFKQCDSERLLIDLEQAPWNILYL